MAAVVLSLQFYSDVSAECDCYDRARKRVVLLVRKALSKTTLKLTQKRHRTPKRSVLWLCIVFRRLLRCADTGRDAIPAYLKSISTAVQIGKANLHGLLVIADANGDATVSFNLMSTALHDATFASEMLPCEPTAREPASVSTSVTPWRTELSMCRTNTRVGRTWTRRSTTASVHSLCFLFN